MGGVRVYLASRSPRRRQLLADAGVPFESGDSGVDDSRLKPGEVSPRQWVVSLAFLKASAGLGALVRSGFPGRWVVLGADTLVVQEDELLGQPIDETDAERMLRMLRDSRHEVLTGVAILDPRTGERDLFVDAARVAVGELTDEQIRSYVASGQWRGKAGAYNLDERLAAGWSVTCEGDPGTVMGLPVKKLLPRLSRMGVQAGALA